MHPLPLRSRRHDAGFAKISEVAGDFRLADAKDCNEITDANFTAGHEVEQAQSSGIGERAEIAREGKSAVRPTHDSILHHIWLDTYKSAA